MKKIMIFAVAALTLAACSKTFDHNKVASGGNAIGFGTWAEQLTKARTQGGNTFTKDDDFAVYGAKIVNSPSSTTTVFDDDVVTLTATGTPDTWSYSPTRFWDKNADSYVFYAISPAAIGTTGTVNPQTGVITSASITFAGNDNDVLVADKETVLKTAYGNTVEMDFNHVAALVDFKVAKAKSLTNAVVNVTGFTLGNIQNKGALSVSDAYNTDVYGGTYGPVVTWSNEGKGSYVPTSGVTPVYGADGANGIAADNPLLVKEDDAFPASPAAAPEDSKCTPVITGLVVKPQAFTPPTNRNDVDNESNANAQKLTISYTITTVAAGGTANTNEYTATLWLADFDLVNDTTQDASTFLGSWLTGKHYTFYITLDANPIVFGAKVNDWGSVVNGFNYLLN